MMLWAISATARFVVRSEDRAALIRHAELIRKAAMESIHSEEDRQQITDTYNRARQALNAA